MSGYVTWVVIAVVLALVFVIGMLVGIRRKSLNVVLFSVLMLLLGMGAAVVAAYQFFKGHLPIPC